MKEFFAFRKLVSFDLMKIMYILGMIGITLTSLAMMFLQGSFFIGLSSLVFGNLFWRVFCEGIMLAFSIHETLCSIDSKMESSKATNPDTPKLA